MDPGKTQATVFIDNADGMLKGRPGYGRQGPQSKGVIPDDTLFFDRLCPVRDCRMAVTLASWQRSMAVVQLLRPVKRCAQKNFFLGEIIQFFFIQGEKIRYQGKS